MHSQAPAVISVCAEPIPIWAAFLCSSLTLNFFPAHSCVHMPAIRGVRVPRHAQHHYPHGPSGMCPMNPTARAMSDRYARASRTRVCSVRRPPRRPSRPAPVS